MNSTIRTVAIVIALSCLLGCETSPSRDDGVLVGRTVSQALKNASSNVLGGHCDPDLANSCGIESGVCMKFGHSTVDDFRCSRACKTDVECGSSHRCDQIVPSETGWYCVPRDSK